MTTNPSSDVIAPNLKTRLTTFIKSITRSKSRMRFIGQIGSYIVLIIIALAMLLPLLWLVNGSFQPTWQINAIPVVWIPREWKSIMAGDTGRKLLLYWGINPQGTREEVIQIGVRRYTATIDATKLSEAQSVPKDKLSDAIPTEVNGITLNERQWSSPTGIVAVCAVARDPQQDNNLIIVEVNKIVNALSLDPLDQVNKAKRAIVTISGFDLDSRQMEDGRQLLLIGPETELSVLAAPVVAKQAEIIQASRLGNKVYQDTGNTQIAIYTVEGKQADSRWIVLVQENWQPLMAQDFVAQHAFIAKAGNLSEKNDVQTYNGLNMYVRTYTPPDGSQPYPVAILIPGSTEYLVISTEYMDQLYAGPFSDLVEPGSFNLGTLTYRVQGDFEKGGKIVPSALVGDLQDLAIIVPSTVVDNAFDANPKALERSTRIKLTLTGYKRVLTLKISGTPFWKFFANSGYVVLMNMIGHFFSCTLVAYGFARFRAPGKDILFVILLGTIMIPGTIVTLPTYLVFAHLGALGTMIPLWVRSFFGNAFLIFILRQFFMSIPYELDEAAILDGASRFQVLLKVILPLSKPALATMGIFTFWWYWNSFLDPLIYITQQDKFTITVALSKFNDLYARSAGYYDRILSGAVLSLLPMVLIFIFAQRYFIEGIQLQGLKR